MNLKKIQVTEDLNSKNHYNKVPIFCADGVHENIFKSFISEKRKMDCKIAVLGSGAGAFERRLLDNGFSNITSIEFIPENFKIPEISVKNIDLNSDFSNIGKFDVVFAIEVIEHLENQFNFVRCVNDIMNDSASFYLSTPNIENTFARMRYFLFGTIYWFGDSELKGTGHINPIFIHILKYNLSQNNLVIDKYFGNSSIWTSLLKNKNPIKKIAFIFLAFVSLFMIKKNNFEINLFRIIKKNI